MTSVCQGPSSLALGDGEMRDPGNEVEAVRDSKNTVATILSFKNITKMVVMVPFSMQF